MDPVVEKLKQQHVINQSNNTSMLNFIVPNAWITIESCDCNDRHHTPETRCYLVMASKITPFNYLLYLFPS